MSRAASFGRRFRARPPRHRPKKIWDCRGLGETAIMRHLKSGSKLGRNPWHRRATLRNLVTNLFEHGRITTTLTRAKAARRVAEKLITLGKRDTLASRRQAAAYIFTPGVTSKLFGEIAPKFADRTGGYPPITSPPPPLAHRP